MTRRHVEKNYLEVEEGVQVVPLQPVSVSASGTWPAWPVTSTSHSSSSSAPKDSI
jgi:hypothetical protein